ncbi:class I SAM-dependent methyltransferase [Novosphingobium sp. P6W]|uniref:class I SAM-dependent methyltransferase n=1 Tax=Novosphingobium sp. P6W TaxID=1609758 RepID=UPI0005C30EFC|nr:class I SAM-dependent methyltransferase [Novosphingobium sp. P6W]AXB75768.1 class I SAM-dependent methyltransferase [Novosphingobium sp. P6W]KIS33020.1 SAM-dependent methyltransferase [Novosphingobium sp. P6W]
MTAQNAYQVADWNGRSGERWVANQQRLDAMLDVFGKAAIAAAAPLQGEKVVDVGCGAGASSFALAELVGAHGRVIGLDISAPLIAHARELARADVPVDFRVADAAADLGLAGFDLLYSRFGVMFFDDPAGAFAALRGALKPGGRLAFVCWQGAAENDWIRLPMGAIRDLLPPPPPPAPEAPGPFSFGDPARITRILESAGFTQVDIAPFTQAIPFGQGATREAAVDDALEMAFEVGPLSRALADQDEDLRRRAATAVRAAFARRPGERSVMIDAAAWIVTARSPAA